MKVFVVALLFCLSWAAQPVVASDAAFPEYHLAAVIEPEMGRLASKARLRLERPGWVTLGLGGLRVTALVVDGRRRSVPASGNVLRLRVRKTVEIAYERYFTNTGENHIGRDEVLLTNGWYPTIDGPVRYTIEAVLPRGWQAIAEGNAWTTEDLGTMLRHRFVASFPITDGVTLAASPHYTITSRHHGDIEIETRLMPEFAANASVYLERMAALLDDYQRRFGAYPHRRLALVEAHIPSSLSMPGFVLMNPGALSGIPRLTTLAHEMVHQWFGNAAYIAFGNGNWAEGAAIYFADHLLDQLDGKGWRCRKRMLQGYHNLVAGRTEIPLARFEARESDLTRWIGYGKGALVFHALRNEIGEEAFFAAIRDFLARHRFRTATWQDLRASAERHARRQLGWFFAQWLERTGLPHLAAEATLVAPVDGGSRYSLRLTVRQEGMPYRLRLPLRIDMPHGSLHERLWVDAAEQYYEFDLDEAPTAVVLDEDYDVPRMLDETERYPIIEQLLAADALTLILGAGDDAAYTPVIETLHQAGRLAALRDTRFEFPRRQRPGLTAHRGKRHDLQRETFQRTRPSAVLILGMRHPAIKRWAGAAAHFVPRDDAACLEVFHASNAPEHLVAVLDSRSAADSQAILERLGDMAGFSRLCVARQGAVEARVSAHSRGWRLGLMAR